MAGLARTASVGARPKFARGLLASTKASAIGLNVTVEADAKAGHANVAAARATAQAAQRTPT
jgi:hypothetical protein